MAVELTDTVLSKVHRDATEASVQELSSFLQDVLGRRITALIAGVSNARTISRWASGEVRDVRDHQVEQRLRTAYEVVRLLVQYDSRDTVRAWFIGLNPQLDDISPVEAIENGDLKEVRAAARAFIVGG